MNKKEINYWLIQFESFGLFFMGIFFGGLLDVIGIPKLAIIVSVSLIVCLAILTYCLEREKGEQNKR